MTRKEAIEMALGADEALEKLRLGNHRYASGNPKHGNQDAGRRQQVLGGQDPYAVIVTCSDSRVPASLIFDVGLGDIFVIRTAGNVLGNITLGSVEYAITHLGTKLVVVMGHTHCGAVTAAVQGGEVHGHLANVVEAIKPAIAIAGSGSIPAVIEANASIVAETMKKRCKAIGDACDEGLIIVPAVYDLKSGQVDFLE
jgi:carbonic anhydrase